MSVGDKDTGPLSLILVSNSVSTFLIVGTLGFLMCVNNWFQNCCITDRYERCQ